MPLTQVAASVLPLAADHLIAGPFFTSRQLYSPSLALLISSLPAPDETGICEAHHIGGRSRYRPGR